MKKIFYFFSLITFLNNNSLLAQWQWAHSGIGSTSYDYVYGVATDHTGNVYATGEFRSSTLDFGNFILTNTSFLDDRAFLVKYSSTGTPIWGKTPIATVGADVEGLGIVSDSKGNIYVTGGFLGNYIIWDDDTAYNANPGHRDIFLVKYSAAGDEIWLRSAGGMDDDEATSLCVDRDDNIYIGGSFYSDTIKTGPDTLVNFAPGFADVLVIKYDSLGNFKSANGGGGNGDDKITGIAADQFNNISFTGKSYSFNFYYDSLTLNTLGVPLGTDSNNLFLVNTDASLQAKWGKVGYGNKGGATPLGISTDKKGNIIIAGDFKGGFIVFDSDTAIVSTSLGDQHLDIFVTKYDSTGNVLWTKGHGSNQSDAATGVATDAGDNIIITGVYTDWPVEFGPFVLNVLGQSDIFVVKYDPAGNVIEAISAGGFNIDQANAICVDQTGDVIIGGFFYGSVINFGSVSISTANSQFDSELFVAKTGMVTSLENNNLQIGKLLNIFPNPASDKISISGIEKNSMVRIYNSVGEKCLEMKAESFITTIDISTLPSGIYLVQSGNSICKKFIVE